jgi:hypothetical protein
MSCTLTASGGQRLAVRQQPRQNRLLFTAGSVSPEQRHTVRVSCWTLDDRGGIPRRRDRGPRIVWQLCWSRARMICQFELRGARDQTATQLHGPHQCPEGNRGWSHWRAEAQVERSVDDEMLPREALLRQQL